MDDEQRPEAVQEIPTACVVMHARAPRTRAVHSTPDVYRILENLKNFGSFIPQISEQLTRMLMKTREVHDVTEYEGKDPAASVALARENLAGPQNWPSKWGGKVAKTQNPVAGQGYRTTVERCNLEEFRRENTGG